MNEAKAKEIWHAKDLSQYTHVQLRNADRFRETYALRNLRNKLRKVDKPIRDYVQLMARCYIGAIETDDFLTKLGCYPNWIARK